MFNVYNKMDFLNINQGGNEVNMKTKHKLKNVEFTTRVPPTVHNTPVKIFDMVYFLTHDTKLYDSRAYGSVSILPTRFFY